MIQQSLADFSDGTVIQVFGDVDAANLCSDAAGDGCDGYAHEAFLSGCVTHNSDH